MRYPTLTRPHTGLPVWGLTLIILFTGGCRTAPDRTRPDLEFNAPTGEYIESDNENIRQESPDAWLRTFNDEQLNNIVSQTMLSNYDVRIAATRVENARSLAIINGASQLPSADVSVGASESGLVNGGGSTSSYTWAFNVRWEADLWSKLRDTTSASVADFEASEADYEAMRHSIAANTARAWYNAITALQQYQLALETLHSYENTAKLIERRFETGISSALELRLALTSVANARSSVASANQQLMGGQRSLQLLIGEYPDGKFPLTETLPTLELSVPVGLPSSLISRRPDIVAAERRLVAADKRFSRSRKDLIPSISLNGSIDGADSSLGNLTDIDYWFWNLMGSITQPIYRGKRLQSAMESAKSDAERATLNYGKMVLNAFREVEQALASEIFLAEREAALKEAQVQSAAAEKLAWDEYTSGISDIITVLESQRRAVLAKTSYISSRNQRIQNRIDLFLALGGSFGDAYTP